MTAQSPARTARDTARDTADAVRDAVDQKATSAKASAVEAAETEALGWYAAAEEFEAGSFSRHAAEQMADRLSDAADAVRGADLGTLQTDVEAFARRNPLLFFGTAALAGFAVVRAVKASERAEVEAAAARRADAGSVPVGQRGYPEQTGREPGQS
jgi:hypothetical protein